MSEYFGLAKCGPSCTPFNSVAVPKEDLCVVRDQARPLLRGRNAALLLSPLFSAQFLLFTPPPFSPAWVSLRWVLVRMGLLVGLLGFWFFLLVALITCDSGNFSITFLQLWEPSFYLDYSAGLSRGIQLAFDEANALGGVHGHVVLLKRVSTADFPQVMPSSFLGLLGDVVQESSLPGLKLSSPSQPQVLPVVGRVVPDGVDGDSGASSRAYVRAALRDEVFALVDFAAHRLKLNSFGILYENSSLGVAGMAAAVEVLQGIHLGVALAVPYTLETNTTRDLQQSFNLSSCPIQVSAPSCFDVSSFPCYCAWQTLDTLLFCLLAGAACFGPPWEAA